MNFENPLKRVERLKKVTRRPDTDLGGRIPPGQFITDKFPVLHYGAVPEVDLATWDFRVFGLVEQTSAADMGRVSGLAGDDLDDRHPLRHPLEQA